MGTPIIDPMVHLSGSDKRLAGSSARADNKSSDRKVHNSYSAGKGSNATDAQNYRDGSQTQNATKGRSKGKTEFVNNTEKGTSQTFGKGFAKGKRQSETLSAGKAPVASLPIGSQPPSKARRWTAKHTQSDTYLGA